MSNGKMAERPEDGGLWCFLSMVLTVVTFVMPFGISLARDAHSVGGALVCLAVMVLAGAGSIVCLIIGSEV